MTGQPLGVPTRVISTAAELAAITTPQDGTEVFFLADATKGALWRLRYNGGSASAFKWEFVGGSSLKSLVTTSESTVSNSYADLATVGPAVTVPLAGDYEVKIGCHCYNSSSSNFIIMSFAIGASVASDNDGIQSGLLNIVSAPFRELSKTGFAANTTLTAKYRVGAGTGQFFDRALSILPVRVG